MANVGLDIGMPQPKNVMSSWWWLLGMEDNPQKIPMILLMAEIRLTSWGNGSLSHYLQGFIHLMWLFGVSELSTVSINIHRFGYALGCEPPPNNSGKWRFFKVHYSKCNLGGDPIYIYDGAIAMLVYQKVATWTQKIWDEVVWNISLYSKCPKLPFSRLHAFFFLRWGGPKSSSGKA